MAVRDAVAMTVNQSTGRSGSAGQASLQRSNSSTAAAASPSGFQAEAQTQLKSPLKLLAAARSRHSRLAAVSVTSSQKSRPYPSLAEACQNAAQLQSVSSIGSRGSGLAASGSQSTAEHADGSQVPDDAAAAHVTRLEDSTQANPALRDKDCHADGMEFDGSSVSPQDGECSAAVAEPSIIGQPDTALTPPADSITAATQGSSTPTLNPQHSSSGAATGAVCTTDVVHDDAAAPMPTAVTLATPSGQGGAGDETATRSSIASRSSSAASDSAALPRATTLSETATGLTVMSRSSSAASHSAALSRGTTPSELATGLNVMSRGSSATSHSAASARGITANETATGLCLVSRSSSAAAGGTGHRQSLSEATARASLPGSKSTSAHKAAGNAVPTDSALQSDSANESRSTEAVMDSHDGRQSRHNGAMGAAEAVLGGEPDAQRTVATRAEGISGIRTSATLSRRSSASSKSSSHAQNMEIVLPQLPAAFSASLQSGNDLGSDGQVGVTGPLPVRGVELDPMEAPFSRVRQREGSPMETSLSQLADMEGGPVGTILPQLADTEGSPMGTILSRLAKAEGNPMATSLSQLGKEGGGGVIRHSVILTGLDPLDQWLYRQPGVLASLDYDKVRTDLQVCQRISGCCALPLHAQLVASCWPMCSALHGIPSAPNW